MTNLDEKKFNLKAAADICGVSVMTIVREIQRRNLGCFRLGEGKGRILISESQLRDYLESREQKAA